MMRIKNYLTIFAIIFCLYALQSCGKSDTPAPTPTTPTPKPDTLTAGWNKQVISGAGDFYDIFFNSSTNGYAVSSAGAYKSTDGGTTWAKLSLVSSSLANCYVNANGKAFFASYPGTDFFITQDDGTTFTRPTITSGSTPIDFSFIDNTNGFLIANDGLYNTVDGGVTWQRITTTGLSYSSGYYASLSFINNTTGWVVNDAGIYKTNASLTTWQASVVNGASVSAHFKSVYAVSSSIIYATDNFGEIFRSTDGGSTFNLIKKLDEAGFTDIHFITDQLGYASSARTIYKTTDAGATWSKIVSLGESTILEIHFTDASHGWACASGGVILRFN